MKNKEIWERRHKNSIGRYNRVTEFATLCYDHFLKNKKGKLLDLCCGKGADSIFFHSKGFKVTALDYSNEAIQQFTDLQTEKDLFITTLVKDITEPLHFEDSSFDFVYSRLGLNYFSKEVTESVFSEIKRILKSEGLLLFQVKSTSDRSYGKGKEVEEDLFEDEGYARRYFSKDSIKKLLKGYKILYLEENTLNNGSSYMDVAAKKD